MNQDDFSGENQAAAIHPTLFNKSRLQATAFCDAV
jgi:hypothetical protein